MFGSLNARMQEFAITSDEGLSLVDFPKRVVIAGGGYVLISCPLRVDITCKSPLLLLSIPIRSINFGFFTFKNFFVQGRPH